MSACLNPCGTNCLYLGDSCCPYTYLGCQLSYSCAGTTKQCCPPLSTFNFEKGACLQDLTGQPAKAVDGRALSYNTTTESATQQRKDTIANIIGSILATLGLLAIGYYLWKKNKLRGFLENVKKLVKWKEPSRTATGNMPTSYPPHYQAPESASVYPPSLVPLDSVTRIAIPETAVMTPPTSPKAYELTQGGKGSLFKTNSDGVGPSSVGGSGAADEIPPPMYRE
ncbi:hypothetical protein HDV05_000406 [Chytridiales sp. JEL 0842]|nr:hypothetical protein HDV05_000406 [Chytridiales sp. JEL 0842]